tara:strand:- start:8291 stop:9301 length:1011 start_codon:yes stop_codon:yes gene_type:complete
MDETQETILLGIIFGFTIVAVAFLSFFSGLDELNFVNPFLFEDILNLVSSIGFIAFVLVLPLPYAVLIVLSMHKEKKEVYGITGIGILLAIISWILLFGINANEILLGVFFIISLRILIEVALIKKDELHRFVTYRTAAEAAKTAFFIFAIGIFISSAMIEQNNQEQKIQEFGNAIMDIAFEQSGNETTNELLADLILNTQKKTITSIMQTPQYQDIEDKTDNDVISFVLLMEALETKVNAESTKQEILDQLDENQQNNQQILTFETLRQQSPLINTVAENLWLIVSSSIALMFIFFSNLIFANLTGVYTSILNKGFGSKGKKPKRKRIEVIKEKF